MAKRTGGFIGQDGINAPDPATGVTGTAGNEQVTVSWTTPSDVGGAAITGYNVQADDGTSLVAPHLSSSSYSGTSFSVQSQDTVPNGLFFKPDGTKMYVVGSQNDNVYQYSLSTAWDVSTASYDSVSFSVASQETGPESVTFSPDGTKMYVGGTANDTVYQYTLSTGWDLSTASYASKSLSVSSQDATLTGFCFNSDGTKLFASGTVSDSIYQYNLSTAYDVSTGSYASKSLDVSSEETNPRDVFLADDDKTLYVVAAATQDAVLKYVMTTANDLSTAYYTGDQLDLSGEQILAQAFFMRADKKVGYTVDSFTVDTVFQYDLAQYPTSSPVTFTGLTNGTSYTFNVWAINPFGWSTASDASGSVSPAQPIGLGQGGDYQHLNKINIATTGNATLFGNLGYGRISAAAFASSTRGVFAGGYSSGHHNTIAYVTFTTEGDATDFGDLTVARGYTSGCSSDTRGLINGGNETNVIDYVTIASVGNATDFGDLLVVQNQTGSLSSTIRAVVKQGDQDGFTRSNVMEYYTIASTGNSGDFGDATVVSRDTCGLSGSTRGIFAGGNDDSTYYDVIQYITIASTGNATDFGDLSAQRSAAGACSSKTRGVIMGGKSNTNSDVDIIEYVTIDTLGNATDFGDLYIPGGQFCATSNVHGGLS